MNYWDEYFTDMPDEEMIKYVMSQLDSGNGYLDDTFITPSNTPVIIVDARLVPPCASGHSIIAKYKWGKEWDRIGYGWLITKESDSFIDMQNIAARHNAN